MTTATSSTLAPAPCSLFAPMPRPRSAVPPPKLCVYVLWGYILTPTPMAGLDTGQAQAPTDDVGRPSTAKSTSRHCC
ncbi:hypothetical protein PR002_g32206 [Phytophthora rubi]|uniref:Uncharacterized protein n=1 Tax=Phytophthora rubi TaxID=129364 RepID=A0A6A3GAH0_9STRA|nr:hypothetical protein PR002_g32206 [Phytophthora rubi]